MARPAKQGLDYFPYDCDQDNDDKLGMIIGEFGEKGEKAFTKLLCWIYKNEGYYSEWKEDVQLRFLRRYSYCGFSMSFINEVVQRCIKWGLFDKSVFESFQILTSVRIQKTWIDASRQRICRFYMPNIWLIEVNPAVQAVQTGLITEVIDKVNKSKVNEKKVDSLAAIAAMGDESLLKTIVTEPAAKKNTGRKIFQAPDLGAIQLFFVQTIGNTKKTGHWPVDLCHNEAGKMYNHYTANGWKQGRGKPIVDWEAAARNWITNQREGAFSSSASFTSKAPASVTSVMPHIQMLSKQEVEINYMYERFCEDEESITITSVEPWHYDLLKKHGFVKFRDELIAEIKILSHAYLKGRGKEINDHWELAAMKKYGVLEVFKKLAKDGVEAIFKL